jgi:hypothetical protein
MGDSRLEEIHIQEFLSLVEGLEILDLKRQKPPEPDFYAQTNSGLIGIEHTRLFKKVDQNGVDPVEEDKLGDDVLKKAKDIFGEISDKKVHLTVSFRSDFGKSWKLNSPLSLMGINRLELAGQLAAFVKNNIPPFETYIDFENPNPWTDICFLPEVIASVNIGYFPKNMTYSAFGASGGHISPTLQNGSSIFESLAKKNSRPSKYEKDYSQIWLVMVTSPFNLTMDFDFDRSELPIIETPFDRVFIYQDGIKKYHELPKKAG